MKHVLCSGVATESDIPKSQLHDIHKWIPPHMDSLVRLAVSRGLRRARSIAGVGLLLVTAASGAWAQEFELPANRSASQILPSDLIAGPHYQIDDAVVSYGYMHRYTVVSDFGAFDVTGDGALRKLVREIHAIAALREIKQTEAFADSIKHAVKAPFSLGKKLITEPVDTLTGLPSGVFQIFGNVKESITMEHDPSEDSRIKQALFVSSWKRDYAAELGVDVYSSNKILQEELNSVGWAAAIGGLTVSAVTMPASATGVLVLKQMRFADQIHNALTEEPPGRLRLINQEKLVAMGVSEELTERFLEHPHFTPRHDTVIVASLEHLQSARGRNVFLESTLSAQDEVAANFFMNIAQTLSGYDDNVSRLREIKVLAGLTVAEGENGAVLIPFPLDHGVWSERASEVVNHLITSTRAAGLTGKPELWVTGTVSPLARQQLGLLGIEVVENVDERFAFID